MGSKMNAPKASPIWKIILLGIALILVAGCATPLTTREQGVLTGTLLGAGAGAALGSISGHAGAGALIGGAAGAITGGLIGDAYQQAHQAEARARAYPGYAYRPGAIWVPPHYDSQGQWIAGRWIP